MHYLYRYTKLNRNRMRTFTRKKTLYAGLWLVPLFLLLSRPVQAQATPDILIKGKVVAAESNEGIPGVNVIVKNSQQGTTTKADGTFTLNVPERPSVLLVSYIGYQTREVTVNTQSTLTITMQADDRSLNEVIVVGYGTVKKSDLTGSVASVKASELKQTPMLTSRRGCRRGPQECR